MRSHQTTPINAASHMRVSALAAIALAAMLSACADNKRVVHARELTGGDAESGRHLIYSHGCGGCHIVAGVDAANGTVGPPLSGFANRAYIAGLLVNTPENLLSWIRHPQRIVPGTAMPELGVSEQQARDIAAYLYTLW